MKLDTSSYYPKSPLDDDEPEEVIIEEIEIRETVETQPALSTGGNGAGDTPREPAEPGNCGKCRVADILSTALSWVMVPLMMPVYGVMLAFSVSILSYAPMSVKTVFTLVTFAFTVLIPSLLVFILKRIGVVQDIGLNGQKERLIPYIISLVALAGTGWFLWEKGAPMWLVMFFAGGAAAAIVNLCINFAWKISAHAAGAAGVVALLMRILRDGFPMENAFVWLCVWIGLCGLLGAARIWLGRHTPMQVIAGYAVGFTGVFLMTLIA